MRRLILPLVLVALAGCQTTSETAGPAAPIRPVDLCPPAVMAASKAEPLPPQGVALGKLLDLIAESMGEDVGQAFDKWLRVTYPAWAREGWTRLDAARAGCAGR